WREHLVHLDHLRSAVGFRGYAQRDPLNEYKTESFELFQTMLINLRKNFISKLMHFEIIQKPVESQTPERFRSQYPSNTQNEKNNTTAWAQINENRLVNPQKRNPNDPTTWGKIGRNESCPCGSGKKYKHCHGSFI
ncbi:MAG: SEC-C metal-binding domain-containing protein, partial [Bartonella sp.]|nr:SEC-C metal-binding domain-containing protein [Bartonella sp.]